MTLNSLKSLHFHKVYLPEIPENLENYPLLFIPTSLVHTSTKKSSFFDTFEMEIKKKKQVKHDIKPTMDINVFLFDLSIE